MNTKQETIAAVSTPYGKGGIAVIRVSGSQAFKIVNEAWEGTDITKAESHSVHLGKYFSKTGNLLDEAVITIFRGPKSFTGEDTVEISVHGSLWIQREILNDLIERGVRMAAPGEFTQRAFLNGKMDLAQAEGVADLISSSSRAAHDLAIKQTKGTFSKEFENLRGKLIEFASLLELELDFSEEDVEFADRTHLLDLCNQILKKITLLIASYAVGSVIKEGVPVAIAGIPNSGKSSLLNLLLGDEKAIVTDIPGTTRDTVEDTIELNGILYRFIDTAGLRHTDDIVESIGIERALKSIEKASIVIWVLDSTISLDKQMEPLNEFLNKNQDSGLIIISNKADISEKKNHTEQFTAALGADLGIIRFSTHTQEGLEELKQRLNELASDNKDFENDIIVTNARHYEALVKARQSLERAKESIEGGISADFIAQDIRETLHHLGLITGTITTDNLLHSIFSRFCIGK